jgi:hypothetical protein
LGLREKLHQVLISAVTTNENNLGEPVARDFPADAVEQPQHKIGFQGDRARVVAGFEYLREDNVREDYGRLKRRRPMTQLTPDEKIGTQWKVMCVPL